MSVRWLICIDDTDNDDSIGTGKLARWLGAELAQRGLIENAHSVTRHQLLVHPDIPYTSHNSSACIEAWGGDEASALLDAARDYLMQHWHEGANPGLCVVRADAVPPALVEIAQAAKREVLTLAEFDDAIGSLALTLAWWGETGQGRIGACSGAALRSTGDDGRFIGLQGIRELEGRLSVKDICGRSGIAAVVLECGDALDAGVVIETRGWVRPSLIDGRALLVVREDAGRLVPAERRSKDDG
jgi:hypothetical protein